MIARLRDTLQNAVARAFGRIMWPSTAVAAVVVEDNKILLVNFKGQFCFPGGIAKSDESLEKTLAREVREETGLEVEVGEMLFLDSEMKYPRAMMVYRCKVVGGELATSWEGRPSFVELEKLPDKMRENHREVLLEIFDKHSEVPEFQDVRL